MSTPAGPQPPTGASPGPPAGGSSGARAAGAPAEDAPFRPRRARAVGLAVAGGLALVLLAMAVGLALSPGSGWTATDGFFFAVLGLLMCGAIVRIVSVRAVPTEDALVVRNVFLTHRVPWGAVVAVRMGRDDPWLTLDTDDGEDLAVMAVQRADGEHAEAEARRLARLVRSRAPRPPRD
ncbi:PH domain-containing protein [Kineococcus gypseus]|uniref:PH domain-containing protein n=1 Tax=Kineococcus gypseus TaxID=1637102 RepID=UPI003D7F0517